MLRRALDRRNRALRGTFEPIPPATGWLKAVREALGMTASQVAARMDMSAVSIYRVEGREISKTATLGTLEAQARAMNCRFVYAVVPETDSSFEDMVDAQTRRVASRLSKRTNDTMELEGQRVSDQESVAQELELASRLKEHWTPGYWDTK
ncbi:MAG: helix-turn-helix domain-containing protein [Clostridia bacterium]|nr:helix-turn-helix domain-containing protein [Deltaproteobacteria bacterium]